MGVSVAGLLVTETFSLALLAVFQPGGVKFRGAAFSPSKVAAVAPWYVVACSVSLTTSPGAASTLSDMV